MENTTKNIVITCREASRPIDTRVEDYDYYFPGMAVTVRIGGEQASGKVFARENWELEDWVDPRIVAFLRKHGVLTDRVLDTLDRLARERGQDEVLLKEAVQ